VRQNGKPHGSQDREEGGAVLSTAGGNIVDMQLAKNPMKAKWRFNGLCSTRFLDTA
jgi:hypothetical protein